MRLSHPVSYNNTKEYIETMTLLTIICSNILSSLLTAVMYYFNRSVPMLISLSVNLIVSSILIYCLYRFAVNKWLIFTTVGFYYFLSVGMWITLSFGHHMSMFYYFNIIMCTIILFTGLARIVTVFLQSVLALVFSYIDVTWRQWLLTTITLDLSMLIGILIVCFSMMIILFIHISAYGHSISVVKSDASTDPLTKSGNRLALLAKIEALLEHSEYPFTLVFIDINDFKNVNDTYGHSIGDAVLSEFVNIIKKYIRDSDDIYRTGGDEFIILFHGMTHNEAKSKMHTVCRKIESEQIEDFAVQFAYGIASSDQHDKISKELLMSLSDVEMYLAKARFKDTLNTHSSSYVEGIGRIGTDLATDVHAGR